MNWTRVANNYQEFSNEDATFYYLNETQFRVAGSFLMFPFMDPFSFIIFFGDEQHGPYIS